MYYFDDSHNFLLSLLTLCFIITSILLIVITQDSIISGYLKFKTRDIEVKSAIDSIFKTQEKETLLKRWTTYYYCKSTLLIQLTSFTISYGTLISVLMFIASINVFVAITVMLSFLLLYILILRYFGGIIFDIFGDRKSIEIVVYMGISTLAIFPILIAIYYVITLGGELSLLVWLIASGLTMLTMYNIFYRVIKHLAPVSLENLASSRELIIKITNNVKKQTKTKIS